jgi:hypothetical protein
MSMSVCSHCNHVRSKVEDDPTFETMYCEVLAERRQPSFLWNPQCANGLADRSDKCENSFVWDCDVKSIIDDMKWLTDRYYELYNAELKLAVVRVGNIADITRMHNAQKKD